MSKKIFVSQPMNGKTKEQIMKERKAALKRLKAHEDGEELIVVNPIIDTIPEGIKNKPLWCLGKNIQLLADADMAYFVKGWGEARGCLIEHKSAIRYGVETAYDLGEGGGAVVI